MDFKLNIFKIAVACICLGVMASCSSSRRNGHSDFHVSHDEFVKAYKVSFIIGCIDQGSKNTLKDFLKTYNDPGLFTEIDLIGLFNVHDADSLGRAFASKIYPIQYEDAGNGKPVLSSCIYFGLSDEIDSIARIAYHEKFKRK